MPGNGRRVDGTPRVYGHWTLPTKLRPPSTGVRHMPRPRLSAVPASVGSFRLALVCAPAGSGKTTALAEWYSSLRKRHVAVAWLSLDGFDNDPRRFVAHLISAIQSTRPDFGRESHGLLTANPDMLMEDMAASMVRDFARSERQTVVFLDDYHEVRDRTIHAVVDFLLRYLPPHVRFVIGTRRIPPLSVERLRIQGAVLEIRWEDLRFNVDETRDYLRETCGLHLSEEQVRALCERTEGWITGLQLAAMAFAGAEDADRFVSSITGVQRKIADYLLESVFRRHPPAVRQFLMKTSILDRITAPLCEALTGRQDSQHLIETLEEKNLFIFGLDDRRIWYRYHNLFSEFLQQRLRTELPDEVAGLYDRASEWCEKNGFPTEAVRYAIAGNRFQRAAKLLETAGRDLFRQGDFQELRRWLDALPARIVQRSPVLCALHAWALAYLGELDGAKACIECAEKVIAEPETSAGYGPPSNRGSVRAEIQLLRAVVGIIRTDEPDVSGFHDGIVSLFPEEERVLRSYASIALGFASRVAGYLSVALRHFQEALVVSEDTDSSLVNLNARLNIGIVNYLMGRMNDAEDGFRKSLEVSRERMWSRSIGAAFLRYGLALVLQERNRLSEALEELSEAIAFLEASDAFGFLGMALVERARILFTLGRPDLADADLAQAREVARKYSVERVSFRADLLESRMAVRASELEEADRCLESAIAAFGGEKFFDRRIFLEKQEYFLMEQLRVLLARKRFGEAVRLAAKGARSADTAGRGRNVIEFLLLEAEACHGLSRTDHSLARLERAVVLAHEEGIVRPFLDAGRELIPLLRRLKGKEGLQRAVAGILSALEDCADPADRKTGARQGEEPFHHREVQILQLMAQGLRNREIGKRLFLSEETVKWYLKRLYCKLYVRTRTEAVARARKLGLLV